MGDSSGEEQIHDSEGEEEINPEEQIVQEEEVRSTSPTSSASQKLNEEEPASSYKHYFRYSKGDKWAKCLLCQKSISRGKKQSTSGMNVHLQQHAFYFKQFQAARKKAEKRKVRDDPNIQSSSKGSTCTEPAKKQLKLTDILAEKSVQKWGSDHQKSKEIDELILRYICLSCEPLGQTEKPGFTDIFTAACPSYTLKGRMFFTRMLEEKYQKRFKDVKEELSAIVSFGLTTDVWTNKNKKKSFLSLTAHYVDTNSARAFKVIASEPLMGAHTGENIGNKILQILAEFGIEKDSIQLIVRDAGSAMIKAIDDLGIDNFDCFCHKMQLAIHDAIEHLDKAQREIKQMFHSCRQLVAFYNRSRNFQDALSLRQIQLKLAQNSLIQDVETRWNSTFLMAKRIIEQKDALTLVATEFKDCQLPNFDLLTPALKVLELFETLTRKLSSRTESISSVLPSFYLLTHSLKPVVADDASIREFKQILQEGLRSRMEKYLSKNFLVISTLIDPRYKNHPNFFDEFSRRQNRLSLRLEMEKLINPNKSPSYSEVTSAMELADSDDPMSSFLQTQTVQHQQDDNDSLDLVLHSSSFVDNASSEQIDKEIDAYLKAKTEHANSDPLIFWRDNTDFPLLKKVAFMFLPVPPASVESERVFSTMGNIYVPKRSKLSGDHAKQQLFLHHNFD